MKPDLYYKRIETILAQWGLSSEEIQDMVDFLAESAADSGLPEEVYLASLGTPEEIAGEFLNQEPAGKTPDSGLPPLPEDVSSATDTSLSGSCLKEERTQNEEDQENEEEDMSTGTGLGGQPARPGQSSSLSAWTQSLNGFVDETIKATGHFYHTIKSEVEKRSTLADEEKDTMRTVFENGAQWDSLSRLSISLINARLRVLPSQNPRLEICKGEDCLHFYFENGKKLVIEQRLTLPWKQKKVELNLWLPYGSSLDKVSISGPNLSIFMEGVSARKMNLSTVNGRIESDHICAETLDASTVNGSIFLDNSRFFKADLSVVHGDVRFPVRQNQKISAEVVTGTIRADGFLADFPRRSGPIGWELNYAPAPSTGKISVSAVTGTLEAVCED